jgi:hypothetical protein
MNEEIRQMCESINQLPKRLRLKAVTECICTAEAEHKLRWATCAFLHDLMDKDCALSWGARERFNHETRMNYEARWLEAVATMLPPLRALKESLSEKQK